MDPNAQDRGDNLTTDAAALSADEAKAAADKSAAEEAAKTAAALEGKDAATTDTSTTDTSTTDADTTPRDDKGRFAAAAIPKSRFDEAVGKERAAREAAERQLAELQAQLQQVSKNADAEKIESEIVDLEKQHAQALLKGDVETAATLMGQIRLKERTIAIQSATNLSAQAKDQAREEVRMDAAIQTLEKTYDVLNPEKAEYDQGLVNLILASQRYLIDNERMLPSAALVRATEDVMGRVAPKPAPAPEKKGLAAAPATTDRKAAAVAKAVAAAQGQPPSLSDVGLDADKAGIVKDIDVTKLTAEEFAALPEATKSRLRGDMIDG